MGLGSSVILDVETTGFGKKDKIWEVAALRLDDDGKPEFFHELIDPCKIIPYKIRQMCGIHIDTLAGKPRFNQISNDLLSFIGARSIIAYNSSFDRRMLRQEDPRFEHKKYYDMLRYVRKVRPNFKSYKLSNVCEVMGVQMIPHRADADVKAVFDLIKILGHPRNG